MSKIDEVVAAFPPNERRMARLIHEHIEEVYGEFMEEYNPATRQGIAYQRKGRTGFFAKLDIHNMCLKLSYCKNNFERDGQKFGHIIQDQMIQKGVARHRSPSSMARYNREAWIDLEKVRRLDEIIDFIEEAFVKRP
ncbi:hypothetical protein [Brevibacillus dissolubilis]|uniref:hypothetical protein n=1 Tax=Brevibacillus dissolubilis TaxID=1844116 RepID=UPI001115D5F6|nr:hypothetical protein [Brevibacillus dissolubilis]